jgi:carbohydrate kinase (thermoresistant glucokinase family)
MLLVVMAVSGSGKRDDFHPASSIARMAAGRPLDDTLRAPWLAAIVSWLAERAARGECAVISCSALTRAYRDVHLARPQDPDEPDLPPHSAG